MADQQDQDLFANDIETQKEILAIETRKTRNALIYVAAVIFVFDLIGLLILNAVMARSLLLIAVVPAIILGLAFLSIKEPLVAIIIAGLLIIGIWIYTIVITGGIAAVSGWIGKIIIIYLLIAGFQHAREASRIKKELGI